MAIPSYLRSMVLQTGASITIVEDNAKSHARMNDVRMPNDSNDDEDSCCSSSTASSLKEMRWSPEVVHAPAVQFEEQTASPTLPRRSTSSSRFPLCRWESEPKLSLNTSLTSLEISSSPSSSSSLFKEDRAPVLKARRRTPPSSSSSGQPAVNAVAA